MTSRLGKAVRLGTQAGVAAAVAGLINVLITPRGPDDHGKLFYGALVAPFSFALFFLLVFSLAYAFPPSSEELALRQQFPGARKVIWPIVVLASAFVMWLIVSAAQ
jgi:hypothetical protein